MVEVTLVASVVTILAGIASVSLLAFKIGSWKTQMEESHEELKKGHEMIHKDVEKIVEHTNGFDSGSREICPVCSDVEDR